jgi:hypothetical protein
MNKPLWQKIPDPNKQKPFLVLLMALVGVVIFNHTATTDLVNLLPWILYIMGDGKRPDQK